MRFVSGFYILSDTKLSSVISDQFLNTLKKNVKNEKAEQKRKKPKKKKRTLKLPTSMVSVCGMDIKKKSVIFGLNLQGSFAVAVNTPKWVA